MSPSAREPPKSAGSIYMNVSKLGPVAAILNEPGRAETRSVSHVTPQILVLPWSSRCGLCWTQARSTRPGTSSAEHRSTTSRSATGEATSPRPWPCCSAQERTRTPATRRAKRCCSSPAADATVSHSGSWPGPGSTQLRQGSVPGQHDANWTDLMTGRWSMPDSQPDEWLHCMAEVRLAGYGLPLRPASMRM